MRSNELTSGEAVVRCTCLDLLIVLSDEGLPANAGLLSSAELETCLDDATKTERGSPSFDFYKF